MGVGKRLGQGEEESAKARKRICKIGEIQGRKSAFLLQRGVRIFTIRNERRIGEKVGGEGGQSFLGPVRP